MSLPVGFRTKILSALFVSRIYPSCLLLSILLYIITQFNTEKEYKLWSPSLSLSSAFYYFVASSNNPVILLFSKVVNILVYYALKTTEYTNQLEKIVSLVSRFVTILGTRWKVIMAKRIGNCHEVTCISCIKLLDVVAITQLTESYEIPHFTKLNLGLWNKFSASFLSTFLIGCSP